MTAQHPMTTTPDAFTTDDGAWNGTFIDDWARDHASAALTPRSVQHWLRRLHAAGYHDAHSIPVSQDPLLMAHGWTSGYFILLTNERGERETVCSRTSARMLCEWPPKR